MPLAGLEPARGFPQQILNLLRLPFRHSDFANKECISTTFLWVVPLDVAAGPIWRITVRCIFRYFLFLVLWGLVIGSITLFDGVWGRRRNCDAFDLSVVF